MKPRFQIGPRAAIVILSAGVACSGLALCLNLSRPPEPALSPEDSTMEAQWSALRDASPEALSKLKERLSSTRALLPAAGPFEPWLERQSRNWTILASATDRYPSLEVRRYALAYNHPTLRAWPDILGTIKSLCAEPGLSLDTLSLAAAPDGSDSFVQAQITLTARLRP
jgi:hypothetical protein